MQSILNMGQIFIGSVRRDRNVIINSTAVNVIFANEGFRNFEISIFLLEQLTI